MGSSNSKDEKSKSQKGIEIEASQTDGDNFEVVKATPSDLNLATQSLLKAVYDDKSPIWFHPVFLDIFADHCIAGVERNVVSGVVSMQAAIDLMVKILDGVPTQNAALPAVREGFKFASTLANMLLGPLNSDTQFLKVLETIVEAVKKMPPGGMLVVPAGWSRKPPSSNASLTAWQQCILAVLIKDAQGGYSMGIINTGEGLEYHPVQISSLTAATEYAMCVELKEVSASRVENSPFWWALLRQLMYPSASNGGRQIYEQLIPALNGKPLSSDVDELTEWRSAPIGGDPSHGISVLTALRYFARACPDPNIGAGLYLDILARFLDMVTAKLTEQSILPKPDATLLDVMAESIAREGAGIGRDPAQMVWLRNAVEGLRATLKAKRKSYEPPVLDIPSDRAVPAEATTFPLMGHLRRDGFDINTLAGEAGQLPIVRAVELSSVPDSVATIPDAIEALRATAHVCALLSNQSQVLQHTYMLRASLIVHVFTRVLPVPMAPTDSRRESFCFWSRPIPHEQQAVLLKAIELVSRHFATVCLSLPTTSTFDAMRVLTFGCMAAIVDAVIRAPATNTPSRFSLHYAGRALGPVKPFGFELLGGFDLQSETMRFLEPAFVVARSQVLEYFTQLRTLIPDDHVIFNFEKSMALGQGDEELIDQLCFELGYLHGHCGSYLCGENRDLTDNYPELSILRDIVFLLKMFLVPSGDDLPEFKQWSPSDAALTWSFKGKELQVKGFGKSLKSVMKDVKKKTQGLKGWFSSSKLRAPPSSADPSVLSGEKIASEEDVLHIQKLPTFGGRLSERDSELLLQYLTAPYLRIPLILGFFADETNVALLEEPALQDVLDACLFEPGQWQTAHEKTLPEMIPPPSRDVLSTPTGLLFNELVFSPKNVLGPVEKLMELALMLDPGKYQEQTAAVILYIVRLATQVYDYLRYLIKFNEWSSKLDPSAPSTDAWYTWARGLSPAGPVLNDILKPAAERMRISLRGPLFKMMETWRVKSLVAEDITSACITHAHLGYSLKNVELEELEPMYVVALLSTPIYLHHNHGFAAEVFERKSKSTGTTMALDFAKAELFGLFQRNRNRILHWLEQNPTGCNMVMETLIAVLIGRASVVPLTGEGHQPRSWRPLAVPGGSGRYAPDTEEIKKPPEGLAYLEWLRHTTTQSVETEINVQLGTFTIRSRHSEYLDTQIATSEDFLDVFGPEEKVKCATVESSINRQWLRLISHRHDVLVWVTDTRDPKPAACYNRTVLAADEIWVKKALDPLLANVLLDSDLRFQDLNSTAVGYCRAVDVAKGKPLREIIVINGPQPVVHIYAFTEHGRHFFKVLVYSSWADLSYACMAATPVQVGPDEYRLESGDSKKTFKKAPSVIITRNVSTTIGAQTYLPPRLLQGLLPQCLLEEFVIWQNANGSLTGYQKASKRDDTKAPVMLQVEIHPVDGPDMEGFDTASATATVYRYTLVEPSTKGPVTVDSVPPPIDPQQPVLQLINLLTAPPGSPLAKLAAVLGRLDSLSHVLVWSRKVPGPDMSYSTCTIDVIELPRVAITFTALTTPDGEVRLLCSEQAGRYISTRPPAYTPLLPLLEGMPRCLLLQDLAGDLAVLVSANAKPLPTKPDVGHIFAGSLLIDYHDAEWTANLGLVKHYLYPVHSSRTFLLVPVLSSALYLLVLRFLARAYDAASRLAAACTSDVEMTAEERQLSELTEWFKLDPHPNATAVRLKLTLVASSSGGYLRCPWNDEAELESYITTRAYVSAGCLLTHKEERELCALTSSTSVAVKNRRKFLEALANAGAGQPVMAGVFYPDVPELTSFSATDDRSVLNGMGDVEVAMKSYKLPSYRPPEVIMGAVVLKFLNRLANAGLHLGPSGTHLVGSPDTIGFCLCYELMQGSLEQRLLPHDSPRELGSLLVHLMAPADTQAVGYLTSVLRVMATNLDVCSKLPEYRQLVKVKKADAYQSFFKDVTNAVKAADKITGAEKIQWPVAYPPSRGHPSDIPIGSASRFEKPLRGLVVPHVHDTSCANRKVGAVTLGDVYFSSEDIVALGCQLMKPLGLETFVTQFTLPKGAEPRAAWDFPVEHHPAALSGNAQEMVTRLAADRVTYSELIASQPKPVLVKFSAEELAAMVLAPQGPGLAEAVAQLTNLRTALTYLYSADAAKSAAAIHAVVGLANDSGASGPFADTARGRFLLAQTAGVAPIVWFELLVGMLMSGHEEEELSVLNPYLQRDQSEAVASLTAAILLSITRMGHTLNCMGRTEELMQMLLDIQAKPPYIGEVQKCGPYQALLQSSGNLAAMLDTSRHYCTIEDEGKTLGYDPRFLVFEFASMMLLRAPQVNLVRQFMLADDAGRSLCHQLIMGAGKTTVITPLLALMMGDGNTLVMQVVPLPLLDFSRGVMRERFSSIISKAIYTFEFDRETQVTQALLTKLRRASETRAVVVTHPTAIKSFVIKYVEIMDTLDRIRLRMTEMSGDGGLIAKASSKVLKSISNLELKAQEDMRALREQARICREVLRIFQSGVLLVDEVDMILHPLKSELNWPLGDKEALDFTRGAKVNGARWDLAWHLLDVIFAATEGRMTVPFEDSRVAGGILAQITAAIKKGAEQKLIQTTPHIILLSSDFYNIELKPLLAQWLLLYIKVQGATLNNDEGAAALESYLLHGSASTESVLALINTLDDKNMKMLNLGHSWLCTLMPHALSKVHRVAYGLLSPADIERCATLPPRSRRLCAVPFVGKDVPSTSSEFSHPDVVIGLSVLAYRYYGLRESDFKKAIKLLQDMLLNEVGKLEDRPSWQLYNKWIEAGGGRVKRSLKTLRSMTSGTSDAAAANPELDAIWPLQVLDLKDPDHMRVVYGLLARNAGFIQWYMFNYVFPMAMEYQTLKLSASGQEIGGDLVFGRRMGFSGTPSDLIPVEFGKCKFEEGDDGKVMSVLTNPQIASSIMLPVKWSVKGLLDTVAQSNDPAYNALIDTGALITGLTNIKVAEYLLSCGLAHIDGVVFLDDMDRKMVLLRAGFKVIPLTQCGIARERLFSFYDQIHTTGMDIPQAYTARALLTLGKDMTFRDYAQGAFRMRGIGAGQTITLAIIPEVAKLIQIAVAGGLNVLPETRPFNPSDPQGVLNDVMAWLIVNQMRSEAVQASTLAVQSISNSWRKAAFRLLLVEMEKVGVTSGEGSLHLCLEVFRERIDLTVPNRIPKLSTVSKTMSEKLHLYAELLSEEDTALVARILVSNFHSVSNPASESPGTEAEQTQEQEQEQEQEQQQQQELEADAVEERVPAKYKKLNYSRSEESLAPFPLALLGEIEVKDKVFYPLSDFNMKGLMKRTPKLTFPPYVKLSNNHYKRSWNMEGHRRLKNVIVMMEWTPSLAEVKDSEAKETGLTAAQEEQLKTVFKMYDTDNSGALSYKEIVQVLRAVDIDIKADGEEEVKRIVTEMDENRSGQIEFKELANAVARHSYYSIQDNRHYVALSLKEAEALRAVLHIRAATADARDTALLPGTDSALCLRTFGMQLDASANFHPSKAYQDAMAVQCFQFFDARVDYADRELTMLLRALQTNSKEERLRFFEDVRACRRREMSAWQTHKIARLFTSEDEFPLLQRRALASRVVGLLADRGLSVADAFMMFDSEGSGKLTTAELYGGLTWLGMAMTPAQLLDLFNATDTDNDGNVSLPELKAMLALACNDEMEDGSVPAAYAAQSSDEKLSRAMLVPIKPISLEERVPGEVDGKPKLSSNYWTKLEAWLVEPTAVNEVWTSRGTLTPMKASIWTWEAPKKQSPGARDVRLPIGYFLAPGFSVKDVRPLVLELRDRNVMALSKSKYNSTISRKLVPNPVRFRQEWQQVKGEKPLYIWSAVPPSNAFVALSFVATNTPDAPPLTALHCLPVEWCIPAKEAPKCVWEDVGAGGRAGSLWVVNSLGMLAVGTGRLPPGGPFYDLEETFKPSLLTGMEYIRSNFAYKESR